MSQLASNTALANIFNKSDLEECVNKNPSSNIISPKTAASVVAALMGLVSLEAEGRTEDVQKVMLTGIHGNEYRSDNHLALHR